MRFPPAAKEELKTFCRQWKFPGPGNPTPSTVFAALGGPQSLVTLDDSERLFLFFAVPDPLFKPI
jgi:hypothetical protein